MTYDCRAVHTEVVEQCRDAGCLRRGTDSIDGGPRRSVARAEPNEVGRHDVERTVERSLHSLPCPSLAGDAVQQHDCGAVAASSIGHPVARKRHAVTPICSI